MLLERSSTCWGLRVVYRHGGKASDPFLAGQYWADGQWTPGQTRAFRTRAEARAAAQKTRTAAKRLDGWKCVVTPVRILVTAKELP